MLALATVAWVCPAAAQCVFKSSTRVVESFSSLATVGGLAHPSGMELILDERGNRVDAILRDYVGEEKFEETRLIGTIKERKSGEVTSCEVQLAGIGKHGRIKIRATILPIGFQGTIERHIGHDAFSQRILLKRRLPDATRNAVG